MSQQQMLLLLLLLQSALADKLQMLAQKPRPILLQYSEYIQFVVTQPRPYVTVTLFTDSDCKICSDLEQSFSLIDRAYYTQNAPVFFITVKLTASTLGTYKLHNFSAVPTLAISYPTSVLKTDDGIEYPPEDVWAFKAGQNVSTHRLLQFINSKTGLSVSIERKPNTNWMIELLAAICLCWIIYVLRNDFKKPAFLFIISILVFWLSVSGIIYNLLKTPQLLGEVKGKIEFVNPQSRQQYALEGYLMGATMTFGGLALVCLNNLHQFKTSAAKRIIGCICLLVLLLSIKQTGSGLHTKLGRSSLVFFPPQNYMSGPLSNDQGITV